jgi:uncharacterized membrane protein YphA (DoxX/SURF4 family)
MKKALSSWLFGAAASPARVMDIAYALFRFYCGISIAYGAGLPKVFHKIDENGGREWANLAFGVPGWFVQQVSDIGFTFISPTFWAYLAVYGEFVGGLLIALGLFTRVSALQMAFQFFVVSFIWYKEPMPFAMYYQQLIFWGFVLIAVQGSGRFSLDALRLRGRMALPSARALALGGMLLCAATAQGQSAGQPLPQRVRFTVSNPTLCNRSIDIRHFDHATRKTRGYGYELASLSSHAVSMPVGTRVYETRRNQRTLLFVVGTDDEGREFNLGKTLEISREQWLQVAYDEQGERSAQLQAAAEDPGLAERARANNLDMVTFKVVGKTPWGREVSIRAQLPFDGERSNAGFTQRLSWFTTYQVSYPVGTKIYLCAGKFWEQSVPETLLFTVDGEKNNYLFRL